MRSLRVGGRLVSPLLCPSKRLGLLGVRRRFYRVASALNGGGGVAGCGEGVPFPVLLSLGALFQEPLRLTSASILVRI